MVESGVQIPDQRAKFPNPPVGGSVGCRIVEQTTKEIIRVVAKDSVQGQALELVADPN